MGGEGGREREREIDLLGVRVTGIFCVCGPGLNI